MSVARIVTGTAALTAAMTLSAGLAATADAAPGGYGSLAVSRLRNAAVAGVDTNKVTADAAAIRDCASYDCEIVLRFTDGCGAVAQGADGAWGWAVGASLDEAQQNAISELGQSAPPFPDLGSAQPVAAHVVTSACTRNVQ
ncbi:DUF4189 domain-containing protein [Nocardia seriolae]|uniref:DUF4189 domain-containing protein n=1 Tax=Nocardia seriolae TaxID=37332 RepID=A0ABC9YQL4_9NOCA|nr:DUF4189 domain-containing protein [Nocardia seriolae]APB00870.1 hypothetical protein NS506_06839 [Nocardia seriolae]WNJ60920.1 DUF4189 domain-containing protein [Nocardia seriolae]BEK86085.1 hypothetical protein NSERKGN1266_20360 [Nocardia seriolae]BEK97981.1 hypothetical protein NSER024013_58870 [Nocardia seriolae]GAM45531.1 hypothetical protein NS07_v2contig00016-0057 [Nocardia seriolae]